MSTKLVRILTLAVALALVGAGAALAATVVKSAKTRLRQDRRQTQAVDALP